MPKSQTNKSFDVLSVVLASTYALTLKTQNYHWNVKGENFYSIHLLLEKQYEELSDAVDEIAELITSLGFKAPATLEEYLKLSIVKCGDSSLSSVAMLSDLRWSHSKLLDLLDESINELSDNIGVTNLLSDRVDAHLKMKWMLQSSSITSCETC